MRVVGHGEEDAESWPARDRPGLVGGSRVGLVSTPDPERPPALSADEQARLLAAVVAAHELAESPLDDVDVDRVRRLARGDLTVPEAYAEVDAEYGPDLPDLPGGV